MKNICLPSQHTQCLPKAYFGSFGSEMCDQAPMIYHWGASNATDFHTGTDHQSVYHLAIPIYIYYSYPQQDGKVIHHQISRDLLIYLFGDEHTCFPTWPCEVSITIHIGDMVVKRNIWLIELKPPIYLSSNRPKSIICPDSSPFTHHFPWVFFNFPSIPLIFPPFSHHFPTIFPPFSHHSWWPGPSPRWRRQSRRSPTSWSSSAAAAAPNAWWCWRTSIRTAARADGADGDSAGSPWSRKHPGVRRVRRVSGPELPRVSQAHTHWRDW